MAQEDGVVVLVDETPGGAAEEKCPSASTLESPSITLLLPNLAQRRRDQRAQSILETAVMMLADASAGAPVHHRDEGGETLVIEEVGGEVDDTPKQSEDAPTMTPPPYPGPTTMMMMLKDNLMISELALNEIRSMRVQLQHLLRCNEQERRSHQFLLAENNQLRRRQLERKQLADEIAAQQQSVLHREMETVRQQQQHLLAQQNSLLMALRVFTTSFQLGGNSSSTPEPFYG